MHGMYVCTPQLAGGNPLVGPNSFKTLGEGPRLVPPKREFPLLTVPTPEGWKAEYTLASRMQIHESLTVLALLTRGEARTSDPWICSLMLYHLSYLTRGVILKVLRVNDLPLPPPHFKHLSLLPPPLPPTLPPIKILIIHMHTHIHTYIHTYTHTYIHTYYLLNGLFSHGGRESTHPLPLTRFGRSRISYIHTYIHTYITITVLHVPESTDARPSFAEWVV